MTSRGAITFHDVAASFSEEQWMRLENCQKEVYRNVMKEIHGSLIALGYTILDPNIIFVIKRREESYVRIDSHYTEKKSEVIGDFPDILMKIKEEPFGETPISQGEPFVIDNQPSTTGSGPASSLNIKQEQTTCGAMRLGCERKFADSSPKASNAALIKAEEEMFSIDDYNSARGEGTPRNNAGVPGVIKQEPDNGDEEETDNEDHVNIIPVIVKKEESDSARNDQDEEMQTACHHSETQPAHRHAEAQAAHPCVETQAAHHYAEVHPHHRHAETQPSRHRADTQPARHCEDTDPTHQSSRSMDPIINLIDEAILLVLLRRRRRMRELEAKKYRRRYRTHPLMSQQLTISFLTKMYKDLRKYPKKFFKFTQMSISTFDSLLEILRPQLTRLETTVWRSVSAEERLLITLRFLATGQTFVSLHHHFHLGVSTVAKVTLETCRVLWEGLHHIVMPEPTEKLWDELADEFWDMTQFPNCIGALDGKKYLSVVLLALSDAHHRFVDIDVGAYGSAGDSYIFRESAMGRRLYEGHLHIPPGSPLPCRKQPSLPYVFVADEAFGLLENLMCPYSGNGLTHKQKIYNYRLSRARQKVDYALRVCTTKWRVLLSSIQLDVENAIKVVLACCVLHNFVIERERGSSDSLPQDTTRDVHFMDMQPSTSAINIRNAFANFFVSSDGKVSWQNDYI